MRKIRLIVLILTLAAVGLTWLAAVPKFGVDGMANIGAGVGEAAHGIRKGVANALR